MKHSLGITMVVVSTIFRQRRGLAHALSTKTQQPSVLLSKLSNPSLLSAVFSKEIDDGKTFPVFNPAKSDQIIAHVGVTSDTEPFISRAANALPTWRDDTTASARADLLGEWSLRIRDNAEDFATIMTMESGKTLQESRGEVAYARSFLDYYAAEAVRPQGFAVPTPFVDPSGKPRGQIMTIQSAVGVTGLITPWNFPLAMIARKVAPALAAGCTAIVKPSELTPLSAIAMQSLLPTNVPIVQTMTPDRASTPQVGKSLCTRPSVRKLSFTGSTAVGRKLMEWSSSTIQRLSLELGGNAPFIVCDDADVEQAVAAAMGSKFRNAGQTCVCADRFLIHENILEPFVKELCQRIESTIRVGPGVDENCNMGPLITTAARESVEAKVKGAIEDGATLALGGNSRSDLGGNFYEPTVLTDVNVESDIWKTETFGPVVAIRSFTTEDECVRLANDSNVGLAAYVCTKDLSRSLRLTQR